MAEGVFTPLQVIESACNAGNEVLRKIRLRTLLVSQPDWSEARSEAVLRKMLAVLKDQEKTDVRKLNIQWLIDHRSGGRRYETFLDALDTSTDPPWPGFPFAPKPVGGAA